MSQSVASHRGLLIFITANENLCKTQQDRLIFVLLLAAIIKE
jgi:hypothetical protein